MQCSLEDSHLHVVQFDGLAKTSIAQLGPLVQMIKQKWGAKTSSVRSLWTFPQTSRDSCGTVALAHYAHHHGLITFLQASQFEHLHELAISSERVALDGHIGFGADSAAVTSKLTKILLEHGAEKHAVEDRVSAAIRQFGVSRARPCLRRTHGLHSNSWGIAKPIRFSGSLTASSRGTSRIVLASKFGIDIRRTKKQKESKSQSVDAAQIDTSHLTLPSGIFATNDGAALAQIPLTNVQKDARGIAFASLKEAQPYLAEGRFITPGRSGTFDPWTNFRRAEQVLADAQSPHSCFLQRYR